MFSKLTTIYNEFPRKFWIVVGVSFIDRIGGTLLFPFFALYITQRFNVGMTQAGIVLGVFSVFGLLGNMIGGASPTALAAASSSSSASFSAPSAPSPSAWWTSCGCSIRWPSSSASSAM